MAHGKEVKAAFAIPPSPSWGTATTCAANDGLALVRSGAGGGAETVPNETASGNLWGDPNRMGNKRFQFPITVEGKFRGLEQLIAAALGATGSTPTLIETGVYRHDITPTTGAGAGEPAVRPGTL